MPKRPPSPTFTASTTFMRAAALVVALAATAPAEEIAAERLTLNDGRVLVGRYDKEAGQIEILDEKSGKPFGKISVKPDSVKSDEPLTITRVAADPNERTGLNGKWLTNYEQALKLAKESKRPVLALFTGSDWCPWCKKLDGEVLSTKEFKQWAKEGYVLLYLDYPQETPQPANLKKQNGDLLAKYHVTGYPCVLFIKDSGEASPWRSGYFAGGPATWTKMVDDQLAAGKRK